MTESNSSRAKWYAAYTKSRTEKKVLEELQQHLRERQLITGAAAA